MFFFFFCFFFWFVCFLFCFLFCFVFFLLFFFFFFFFFLFVCFLFFIQKTRFDISYKLSPIETMSIKCQILFSSINSKYFSMSSAEHFSSVLSVNKQFKQNELLFELSFQCTFNIGLMQDPDEAGCYGNKCCHPVLSGSPTPFVSVFDHRSNGKFVVHKIKK